MLTTPARLEEELQNLEQRISNPDTRYQRAIDVLCDTLDSLGYEAGVQMFKAMANGREK